MLRFEISEHDQALPILDLADDVIVIGSEPGARIRLPGDAVQPVHVRIAGQSWTLHAEARLGGMVRAAGDSGSIGHGMVIEIGAYRVKIGPAPVGSVAAPPQRTESLARELVRNLLGEGAAPALEVERGPHAGARRTLAPPESSLVIGRGDEAGWVIVDEDLSRAHAEVRRGWDGAAVVDLGSKNGTRVNGGKIGATPVTLADGDTLALGGLVLRFHDPAERHLRGESLSSERPVADPAPRHPPPVAMAHAGAPAIPWSLVGAGAIIALALAALIWVLVG
ncbi:MAG TPA: FHA domain-containing protein [Kofleriaceae bacterium]|nr:FHA domain-containing protein [Kofleriaceae bacterium]